VSPNLRDLWTITDMVVALKTVADLTHEAARMAAYTDAAIPVDLAKRLDRSATFAAERERALFPERLVSA